MELLLTEIAGECDRAGKAESGKNCEALTASAMGTRCVNSASARGQT